MIHLAYICICGTALRADLPRAEAATVRELLRECHQGPGHRLMTDAWSETQSRKMTQKPAKQVMRVLRAREARHV